MEAPEPILECRSVTKSFQTFEREKGFKGLIKNFVKRTPVTFTALKDIDLSVRPGEFVGLIGANGAGKTTLVKCLTGIIPVTSGVASLLGRSSFELRNQDKRRLSVVMGQRSQLWWDLPALDSFKLLQEVYQVPQADFEQAVYGFADELEVRDRLGVQLRQLSLGQRMKMEIIGALLHGPDVIFLDEPTIGLDLISRETIRRFLIDVNRERGATIVLTSHDMEDIEETCKRLVILESGSILFDGPLVQLSQRVQKRRVVEIFLETPMSAEVAEEKNGEAPNPESKPLADLLSRLGADQVGQTSNSMRFGVAAERTQDLVAGLLKLFAVRDLHIERQPLEQLIKQIFAAKSGVLPEAEDFAEVGPELG